jgi:LPS sulfotransferase NodH
VLTYDLAGAEGDYPEWKGPPRRSIVICTHQRSGSSLLGEALTFAGGFGCPLEYFHGGFRPTFEQRWDVHRLPDYVAALHRHRTDPTGTLAVKLFWGDVALIVGEVMPALGAVLGKRESQTIPDDFYRTAYAILCEIMPEATWVRLERQDLIRQSISHVRALRSNRWRGIPRAGLPLNPPVPYDFADLLKAVQWAHNCQSHWRRFFAANALSPYMLHYEALVADRDAQLLALFRALGAEHATVPELRIQKQADGLSDEWHRRFLRDFRQRPAETAQPSERRDAMD